MSMPPDHLAGLPAGVLWDMDGTLVDTEPYWFATECELAARHGGHWTEEQARSMVGNDLRTTALRLRQDGGVDLPVPTIAEAMVDGMVERVRRSLPWRPGAQELLAELVALGVPCALVTMSYRRLTRAVLDALPAGSFAAVVAGDDVTHGKPHPEPYLTAAARLGAPPGDCVAIEDSPAGLASALAAGVPALGVRYLVPLEPNPGRRLVDSLVGLTAADLGRVRDRVGAPG
jgi:HAD superfamily hydrolase (TIGR01509 family)